MHSETGAHYQTNSSFIQHEQILSAETYWSIDHLRSVFSTKTKSEVSLELKNPFVIEGVCLS